MNVEWEIGWRGCIKKELWCPAYSKDYFSGGVLSSQRSESTNHSLNNRLHVTQGLCDFYKVFVDVVEDWRENENAQDYRSLSGNKHLALGELKLLTDAKEIYTVAMYLIFEENFIKGASCEQKLLKWEPPVIVYHVRRTDEDFIMHTVSFDQDSNNIDCTCKYLGEMGLLCAHSLQIFHINNVTKIPNKYIVRRWTKGAMCTRYDEIEKDVDIEAPSIWRVQTTKKMLSLIYSSQDEVVLHSLMDLTLNELKETVVCVCGKVDDSITMEQVESMLSPKVKDPPKKRKKGSKDIRMIS